MHRISSTAHRVLHWGDPMEYVIRLNWQQWAQQLDSDPRYAHLPISIDVLIALMLDNWWMIATEPYDLVYNAIADGLDEYSLEDIIGENLMGPEKYNPTVIYEQYVEPCYPRLVEVVYGMFAESRGQIEPLFNNQHAERYVPHVVLMQANAIVVRLTPAVTPIAPRADMGFIAQEVLQTAPNAVWGQTTIADPANHLSRFSTVRLLDSMIKTPQTNLV